MENLLVPPNREGKKSDLEHSVTLSTKEEAQVRYGEACKRMLDPDRWHELCGMLSAKFILVKNNGNDQQRMAQVNDFIKIDIPGPGPTSGGGYDWVKVDLIENKPNPDGAEESCGMRVRPCSNPENGSRDIAHFFQNDSTSSFVMRRKNNTVTAFYHGRNEIPNVHMGKKADNIRNAIITSGALSGVSELQWSILIKSFVED